MICNYSRSITVSVRTAIIYYSETAMCHCPFQGLGEKVHP